MLRDIKVNADEGVRTEEEETKEEETKSIETDNKPANEPLAVENKNGDDRDDKDITATDAEPANEEIAVVEKSEEKEVHEEDPKKLPKELEEHEVYSGCAERQFTTCGSCLFNGNTWETRTTWCTKPQFCFESTDPEDHMFDPFCKGELLTATNEESLHTVKMRCGEEHEITTIDIVMHHKYQITAGAVLLFVCILFYLRSRSFKRVKAAKFLFKDSTDYSYAARHNKKHDDLRPEAVEKTPKTMKRAAMTPSSQNISGGSGISGLSSGKKTPEHSHILKSWSSSFDSQDSGNSEFGEDPGALVTPFASPMSKTFCASSDDV